jgi:hypothetical protein
MKLTPYLDTPFLKISASIPEYVRLNTSFYLQRGTAETGFTKVKGQRAS